MLVKSDDGKRVFDVAVIRMPVPDHGQKSCDDCSFYNEYLRVGCPKTRGGELLCLRLKCNPKKYINFVVEGVYKKGKIPLLPVYPLL